MKTVDPAQPPPTLRDLFGGFLSLGLMGFGGVMPLARRIIVEERRWLTGDEFIELLGLCQFLPGGNIINMSVAIGSRFHGVRGAIAALAGLIGPPTAIVLVLGSIYERFQGNAQVRHLFAGLAAAAAGLMISMALKLLRPLLRQPTALLIVLLCFVAIAVLRLPLVPTMLVLSPLSILLRWRMTR